MALSKEERSSIGRRNRKRGSSYELRLCKKLQEWWDPGKVNGEFKRTAGSGGSQWKNSHNMQGDVCTVDETFPFHIEAKNADWKDFQQALTSPKWIFWSYWEQAVSDCPPNKIPTVIMTKQGSGTKNFILFESNSLLDPLIKEKNKLTFNILDKPVIFCMVLEDFFEISPEKIKNLTF